MIYPKLSDGTIDWCAMCKHEGSVFYDLCCECEYPENSDDPTTKYEPKPMTNADRIRSMSDEELAEWLANFSSSNVKPYATARGEMYRGTLLDWLRQEAEA